MTSQDFHGTRALKAVSAGLEWDIMPMLLKQHHQREAVKQFWLKTLGQRQAAVQSLEPKKKPGFGKTFTVQKAASLDYKEGDRVKHAKFGEGTVKEIIDGARDYEITVEFDKGGQKKMLAGFAKLERV